MKELREFKKLIQNSTQSTGTVVIHESILYSELSKVTNKIDNLLYQISELENKGK